jgi:YVTN family beta-propeller protein
VCPGGLGGDNRAGGAMAADAPDERTEPAEFGILGPLQVLRAGFVVPLGGPRQRAVLALLLLEANRVASMDRLAEDVWGGSPPEGWATTLQTYVFHLRRALEPGRDRGAAGDVLVTRDRGYLLRVDPERLDAARFTDGLAAGRAALEAGRYAEAAQTLRQALELWRGPVLADLADYAFTRPEAARLEELRLAAVEARIDADLALGRHDTLVGELEQLAAGHPLRERLHGQLMLALYRCGRQADALAAYRRVRDLLADELGIDPGEPLQRLHACVLAHDPALDWHPESHPRPRITAPAGTVAVAPEAGRLGPRPAARRRELDWTRRHARRVLAIGSALAIAAAVVIVAVARPWAAAASGIPANSVGLIGAAGGRVGAPVAVGSPDALAYGDGSVWAVDGTTGTLARINPATHAIVDQIPVGSAPSAVTVTHGNVWVANSGDGTVTQINTAANAVVQTILVGNTPVAIASGPSGVWVANSGDDTVDRINPATGTVTRTVQVGELPDGIAVGPRAVWVANGQDGTVTRIDPASDQPSGPILVGSGPEGIAVTPGAVWVANSLDLTVSKLNPTTGIVTGTTPVGDGPSGIVAASNAIWVSDEFDATLDRINLQTGQLAQTVHLGSSPRGIAAVGSGVWVAARAFASASHRGGTLTDVNRWLPDPDPTLGYAPWALPELAAVYDSLVTLSRSGGTAGLTLVPDLATSVPRPTDGGMTYTFTLRRGIRYSNGTLVRASDVRRGIERLLILGLDPPGYYDGILGAQTCPHQPRRCDLSAGIVTNDTAGTVTFHLSQPNPDFLDILTLLIAAPVPPGTPDHAIERAPFIPGTGPYMISQYRRNASLTLVRNPYFRQWSYAAQPAGYPDVIRFEQIVNPVKQEAAVLAGRADLVDIAENSQPYHPLAIRYPTRLHPGFKDATYYFFLDTRQPPFTNIKARQAFNYAIDRARIIQLLGLGSAEATPTCQIVPADFTGHQSYCPYTPGAQNGDWHGPDMAKARRLAKESGTTRVPVTVWTSNDQADEAASSYLVQLLRELGYKAKLHAVSTNLFFTAINNSRNKIQVGGVVSWYPDFPAPFDFFLADLSCHSFNVDPTNNGNWAGFCDPQVDKLASQAQAAQLTDPAYARRLWAQVDRMVTDQAPWLPVFDESFSTGFVSSRVGNYQDSPFYGPLLDQMWVR